MYKNFKKVGHWWADKSIGLVEINGEVYALHGWNGEQYLDCWKCSGEFNMDASEEKYEIEPIYKCVDEENEEFKLVGYKTF